MVQTNRNQLRNKDKAQSMKKLLLLFIYLLPFFRAEENYAQQRFFYGSLHSHSEYSDGNAANDPNYQTVNSCFEYIRQFSPHVNYWGISDHNHASIGMTKAEYHLGVAEALLENEDEVFTSLYGMEWGVISTGGHVLIYGFDSIIGWENNNYDIYNAQSDYAGLFNKVAARGDGAFAYLAHMEDTDYGNLLAQPYNATWDNAIVGIALRNGPAFSTDTLLGSLPTFNYVDRFTDLLRKGYHVAPGIDHDNHYIVFGRTHPGRTVVFTDSLNRGSIMQAFRDMHFYASDDWNAEVTFTINGNTMGSICSDATDPTLHVHINDADIENISSIRIWYGIPGNGITAAVLTQVNANDTLQYTHTIPASSTYYYFAEITQSDGDKIWTAPIWFTRNGNPPAFELLNFSAINVNEFAQLNWSTNNETNLDRIEVEKSTDNNQYNTATQKAPTGGIGTIATYNWTDPDQLDTATFYRLNFIDLAGLSTLSPVRRVDPTANTFNIVLSPNIGHPEDITISVSHNREEAVRLEIYNETGQLVTSTVFYTTNGTQQISLKDKNLAAGLYFLRIFNSDYTNDNLQRFILY